MFLGCTLAGYTDDQGGYTDDQGGCVPADEGFLEAIGDSF